MRSLLLVPLALFLACEMARAGSASCAIPENNWLAVVSWTKIARKLDARGAVPGQCQLPSSQPPSPPHLPDSRHQTKSAALGSHKLRYDYYPATLPNPKGRQVVITTCGGPGLCRAAEGGFGRPAGIPGIFDVIVFDYPGMGNNADLLDGISNPSLDDVAKAIPAIVKAEGLVGSQGSGGTFGNYLLYGVSFGTMIATIGASQLQGNPPTVVLLDSAVAYTTESKAPNQPTIEELLRSTGASPAQQQAFLQKYRRVLSDVGNGPANHEKAPLDSYFAQLAQQGQLTGLVTQPQKWSLAAIESCVARESQNHAFKSKADFREKKQTTKLMKVEFCGAPFDANKYSIPASSVIDYLVGTADDLTPVSMARYHERSQSKCSLGADGCQRAVSVFTGTRHGDFTMDPVTGGPIAAACETYVWNNIFSQFAMDFSTLPGKSGPCPVAGASK